VTALRKDLTLFLEAIHFAAEKHRDQRRKGQEASPYINHTIEVAHLLLTVGGVSDPTTLTAAILHDTIEDTDTAPEELEERFGKEIRQLVEEVTDDKELPWEERKRLQVQHTPDASHRAKLIKLADKISNVRDVTHAPPRGWSHERRRWYLEWTAEVIAGCRGTNPALEMTYEHVLREGLSALEERD
jgi:guanosine-3',5'-bis(diphosphate) 3'-pyrophosphohydrolase